MLAAVLRAHPAPSPIPIPPLLLPAAPARPLLVHLISRRLPHAPMASSRADGAAAKTPDAAPAPAAVVPEPPEKPLPGDCCGSGCARCVWDVYYDELEDYQKALAAHAASNPAGDKAASADGKAKS